MSEVLRYKAIKLKTEAGNIITYTPHGPDFVPAEAYDQLRAELAALKVRQGEAVAYVSEESFSSNGTSDIITCNLPIGTALYTASPASADAVSVPRELLERLVDMLVNPIHYNPGAIDKRAEELRALLAQSESEGVKL